MTIDFIAHLFCRSLIFITIYHIISYQIRFLKRKNVFTTMTLFKLELLCHVVVKIWVLEFVSLSNDQTRCENASESLT